MKKLCLFSVLTAMCANAAYAADIASNATTAQCVEPTLHRYEGTANLQAQWEANSVSLRWYSNHTLIDPTDATDDCQYAGSLTRPTNPSRTGFTFTGWKVRPLMDFSNLNSNLGSVVGNAYGKGVYNNADYCLYYDTQWHEGAALCKQAEFTELQQQEWKQSFANGTVYGFAHCSAKSGNHHEYTWPAANRSEYAASLDDLNTYDTQHSTEQKKYCWCQATGYKPTNQTVINGPLSSLAWVFRNDDGSASDCAYNCAPLCARDVRRHSAFRAAVFKSEN